MTIFLRTGLAATPVETIQPHCMRVGEKRGDIAHLFDEGWKPELESPLAAASH
jgi:hypothetical protein